MPTERAVRRLLKATAAGVERAAYAAGHADGLRAGTDAAVRLMKAIPKPALPPPEPAVEPDDDARELLHAAMLAVAERHAGAGTDPAAELAALADLADDPGRLEELLADDGDTARKAWHKAARWEHDKHPRDKGGRFISKDAIAEAKTDPAKAAALRDRVKPEDAGKLDDALAGKTDLGRTKRGQAGHEAGQRRHTRETARRRVRELNTLSRSGDLDAGHFRELADILGQGHLTADDLRNARASLGASWGGERLRKQGMVDKLVAFSRDEATNLTPKKPAPKPAARRPKSDTLAARIRGKINPADPAFLKYFSGAREAMENGVPLAAFDKTSTSRFDVLAREMAAAGEFYHDEHEDPADALADLLQTGARTALADRTAEYADKSSAYDSAKEDAWQEGKTAEEIAAAYADMERLDTTDPFAEDDHGDRPGDGEAEGGGGGGDRGEEAAGGGRADGEGVHPDGQAGHAEQVDTSFDFGGAAEEPAPNPALQPSDEVLATYRQSARADAEQAVAQRNKNESRLGMESRKLDRLAKRVEGARSQIQHWGQVGNPAESERWTAEYGGARRQVAATEDRIIKLRDAIGGIAPTVKEYAAGLLAKRLVADFPDHYEVGEEHTADGSRTYPAPRRKQPPASEPSASNDTPRNPLNRPDKQLDIFGQPHATPRPAPPAVGQSLIPRDVERAEDGRRTAEAVDTFVAGTRSTEPLPDATFDRAVLDAAASVGPSQQDARLRHTGGRWGRDKVFISDLYDALKGKPGFAGMSLDDFKGRLIDANRQRRLTLNRVDLPQFADPARMDRSRATHLGSDFHVVTVPESA